MDMALGSILTGAVFSLPFGSGRVVMRFSSISMFHDSAYGMGVEILALDSDGRLLWSMEAPYARITPLSPMPHTGPMLSVLLRALDRIDANLRWEPVVEGFAQNPPDTAQIALPVSWDDFVLISDVRRGIPVLSLMELRRAAERLSNYGYKPAMFEVELLGRFVEPALLLILGILAIVIGWRFRAVQPPRFMGFLMLGILPMVFFALVSFCRALINNLGIFAVVSLGFPAAAVIFAAVTVALFVVFLIALVSQHG
jgi:hypothetical protein